MFQFPKGQNQRKRQGTLQSDMQSEVNRVEDSYYQDEYGDEDDMAQS